MARPAQTLILVTRHSVVRADFRRGAVPFGEWSQPRPELPDLASVVEYALSLGPRPARAVWVLATDLWTQTLGLPVAKVAGLKATDLAQALAFEAESFSGIPAYESNIGAVAFPPAKGERVCWFTQVRQPDRDAIAEAVVRSGGSLAGLLHPAGLPQRLHGTDGGSFERLELWPDVVLGLKRDVDGRYESRVWNSDPPLNKWQSQSAGWIHPDPISNEAETLTADGLAEPRDRLAPVISLEDAGSLKAWLAGWAAALAKPERTAPVIPAPVRAMTAGTRAAISVALAVVVAALVAGHSFLMNRQLEDLNATLAQEKATLQNADDFNKMVEAKATERDKLRADRGKLEKDRDKLNLDRAAVKADRGKVDAELATQKSEREMAAAKLRLQRERAAEAHMAVQLGRTRELRQNRDANADEILRHRERFARLLEELAKRKPDDLVIRKIEQNGGTITISGIALMPSHPDRFATDLAPILRPLGWSTQPAKTSLDKQDDVELHAFSIGIVDLSKLGDAPAGGTP